jgi:hypothetical protein
MGSSARPPFRGFSGPNYTPVPDELFDDLLVDLSGAELKLLMYIIRRTFGFKRGADAISLSQMLNGIRTPDGRVLDRGVGLSKKTLLLALRTLTERRIILTERRRSAERGNEPTIYQLNVIGQDDSDDSNDAPGSPSGGETPPALGGKLNQGQLGAKGRPPLGGKLRQTLGEKSTPTPRAENSPTQETVLRETVRRKTVEQKTAGSTPFDGIASMQQDREASGFSKTTSSDAPSRRAETALAAPPPAGHERDDHAVEQQPHRPFRGAPSSSAGGPSPARPRAVAASEDGSRPQIDDRRPTTAPYGALSGIPDDARRRTGPSGPPPRLPAYLADLVTRYSEELHDPEHVPQNLGQAGRLWEQSGWSEASFGQALTEAKAITLRSNVRKRARVGGELGARNKMPFYFTVLRDILGVKKTVQAHVADA